jgi:hypothetical protein
MRGKWDGRRVRSEGRPAAGANRTGCHMSPAEDECARAFPRPTTLGLVLAVLEALERQTQCGHDASHVHPRRERQPRIHPQGPSSHRPLALPHSLTPPQKITDGGAITKSAHPGTSLLLTCVDHARLNTRHAQPVSRPTTSSPATGSRSRSGSGSCPPSSRASPCRRRLSTLPRTCRSARCARTYRRSVPSCVMSRLGCAVEAGAGCVRSIRPTGVYMPPAWSMSCRSCIRRG